jgi:DNA-binding response OmpR family regulator
MYVLVVEDDERVARIVARGLSEAGNRVEMAHDGLEGLQRAGTGAYDIVILDILLPHMDGLTVCRQLRKQRVRTPILMLTARDSVPDRVRGLDAGADDYLVKPFSMDELHARIRALVRRAAEEPDDQALHVGDLTLDLGARVARRGDRTIELTTKEFEVLEYLMRHRGQVLTKSQMSDHVWGYDAALTSNVVETYIHYLRNKIDRGYPRPLIRTIRGVGYSIRE